MIKKRNIKRVFRLLILIFLIIGLSIFLSNWIVERSATKKLYNNSKNIPYNKVGLLLGTGKYLLNGRINLYYKYRIDAAVKLIKLGKVDFILVSGDNSRKDYDEPSTIKNDLISKGVPADKVYLDYAGFRTLDSVVRSNEIFGQESITVISQQFHNERALFIAKRKGIKAVGFNAKDVSVHYGFKTRLRERLARVKMIIDLIFGKKPRYSGNKIEIK